MSSYYNKNNNLVKIGMVGEEIAKHYLTNILNEEFIKFNHDDEYDIKTNKGKYEIKIDFNNIIYNSVFCEFMSNNLKSGIEKSKANFYIFVCPNNKQYEINVLFIIETNKLKDLIEQNKQLLLIKNAPCKDYNNKIYSFNMGYIIPNTLLLKYGILYQINLNDFEDLKNIIKNI